MKYILLKNGHIVQEDRLLTGSILIGNNRIIEIGTDIKAPTPYTEIIDLSDKYLLPGLIHFNCSFLKSDTYNPTNSAIYIALSHGATFLIDTVKPKQEADFSKMICSAREGCKPIITDYGFHLRAYSCNRISCEDLVKTIFNEGITSFFIRWKDLLKMENDELEQLFELAAKLKLLIICESYEKDKDDTEKDHLVSRTSSDNYFNMIMKIIEKHKCPFLFYGISTWKELDLLFSNKYLSNNLFASVNLNSKSDDTNRLECKDLEELMKNPNIILSPPELILPNSQRSHFIENDKTSSFLSDLIYNKKGIDEDLIVKVCEMYASRPAKLLGIYPQKGVLDIGADADIIVWNPSDPHIMKTRGTNTFLLRKDINALIINGKMITDEVYEVPYNLEGSYVYRNTII